MRRTLGSTLLAAAVAVALATAGCSVADLLPSGVIEPSITPAAGVSGSRSVDRAFSFEDYQVTLHVPVDNAVYAGSQTAPKSAVLVGDAAASDWVPGYYRAFVDEKHQEAFYSAILGALHDVRSREGLDSSRYVELVTSMAQAMEYRIDTGNLAPKFPIETFADGYGDCDDKTLLAAGILSRDGYDVCILMFEPEKHVALGIRAPGLDYAGTGYAYVEMTAPSLVGIVPEKLAGGVRLTSRPDVIKVGDGSSSYQEGDQITSIQRRMTDMKSAMERLQSEISMEKSDLTSEKAALDAERQAARAQGSSAAIDRYNQDVVAYNARVTRLDQQVSKYNALVEVQRYVVEHQFARPQVYQRLRSMQL